MKTHCGMVRRCAPLRGVVLTLVWCALAGAGADEGYVIQGRVTESGAGAPGIWIDLFQTAGTWVAHVQSGDEGAYAFSSIPPGDYKLVAYTGAALSPVEHSGGSFSLSGDLSGMDFSFAAAAYGLSGTVTRDGGAADGVWLDLFTTAGAWVANVCTGADGAFAFNGIEAGDYSLVAYTSGSLLAVAYAGNPLHVDAGMTGLTVGLDTLGTVTGTVQQGAEALAGAWVDLFDGTGRWLAHGQTDSLGRFSFTDLPAGDYDVTAYAPASGGQVSLGGLTLAAGGSETVSLAFAAAHALRGTVSRDTAALSGVWLDLFHSTGAWLTHTQTDGAGAFAFEGIAEGTYRLVVYEPATMVGHVPLTHSAFSLSDDETVALTFCTAAGTVFLDGEARSGVWLDIFDEAGTWCNHAQTGMDGSYTLGPVLNGSYTVRAYHPMTGESADLGQTGVVLTGDRTGVDAGFLSGEALPLIDCIPELLVTAGSKNFAVAEKIGERAQMGDALVLTVQSEGEDPVVRRLQLSYEDDGQTRTEVLTLSMDASGVLCTQEEGRDEEEYHLYEPGRMLFPASLFAGASMELGYTWTDYESVTSYSGTGSGTCTVSGPEVLAVGACSYQCWKVTTRTSTGTVPDILGMHTGTYEDSFWVAPGVGIVQIQRYGKRLYRYGYSASGSYTALWEGPSE